MTMLATSALDVALAGAIAAGLAGVIAPITALLVTRSTHRHELQLRAYEEKRKAYVGALENVLRRIREAEAVAAAWKHGTPQPEDLLERYFTDEFYETRATEAAYLADDANKALRAIWDVLERHLDAAMSEAVRDESARPALAGKIFEAKSEAAGPFQELQRIAKRELHVE